MKKMLLVLLILVALAMGLALVWSLAPQQPARLVEMSFLQFTNTPNGPSARFAVSYGQRFGGCGWGPFEISRRRADGTWESWDAADHMRNQRFYDNPPPQQTTPDGKNIYRVWELPVENTNAVWRFVVKVDENPPWLPWPVMMANQLKRLVGKQPQLRARGSGHSYFLTNQTSEVK